MRTKIMSIIEGNVSQDEEVEVKGWVQTLRSQKSFSFININDGTSIGGLQIVVDGNVPDYDNLISKISTGTAIAARGILKDSPGKEQNMEIQATSVAILGECHQDYPLQKKHHSFEFLRSIAHLRPRTNTGKAMNRIRSECAFAIHRYFHDRHFVYIHSPIITASDCEGAGEQFCVTKLMDRPFLPRTKDGSVDYSQDFFGTAAFLTVSGQLNAEACALALGDVYTFAPTFRAENSHTSRHLAEFWMVEPEMAFADLNDDIDCAESLIKFVYGEILNKCTEEVAFFDKRIFPGLTETLKKVAENPFQKITYTEAIEILQNSKKNFQFPTQWGNDLQSEHESFLADEYFKAPVVVYNYPKDIKAFYMRLNDDNKTVASMDVFLPNVGEVVGGSQREERLEVLLQRIADLDIDKKSLEWYIDLRRYGSVVHSGFGLGFERLLKGLTGLDNIRDIIPFPRVANSIKF